MRQRYRPNANEGAHFRVDYNEFIEAAVADFLLNGFHSGSSDTPSKETIKDRISLEIENKQTPEHIEMVDFIKNKMADLIDDNSSSFLKDLKRCCMTKTILSTRDFGYAACIPKAAKELMDKEAFDSRFANNARPYPMLLPETDPTKIFIRKPDPDSYSFTDIVQIESMYKSRSSSTYTNTVFRFRSIHGQSFIWYSSTEIDKFKGLQTFKANPKRKYLLKGNVVRDKEGVTQINRVRFFDWDNSEPTDKLLDEKEMVKILKKEPYYVLKILNPSHEMLKTAITAEPFVVKHLGELDYELQEIAVKKCIATVGFLTKPNGKLQSWAFDQYPTLKDQVENVHVAIEMMDL